MTRSIAILLTTGFLSFLPNTIHGQQPHHPQINVGHPGIAPLKKDLEYLLSLTSAKDQAQLQNLIDFIDLLAFGLDEERPLRVDIHAGNSPPTYMIWAPFKVFEDLDENLQSNFSIKKVQENLYEVLPPDNGWFRSLPAIKYALLVLSNPADHLLLKQLILKAVDPLPAIKSLLEGGSNLGIQLVNDAQTKEDQKKRTDSFGEIRAVRMDALQKRPTETKTEFDLRKGIIATQLDEVERLFVEASQADARVIIDKQNHTAEVLFNGKAIAETSLAASAGLFGKVKDAFGAIKKAEGSVLSLRVNHPIDKLRAANSNRIIDLIMADAAARLASTKELSAAQKKASQELLDGVMQVTRDNIASGNINAFLETVPDSEGNLVSYGAMSVVNGERLNDILPLIADSGPGNKIEKAVEKIGNVTFHKISFAKGYLSLFDKLFGANNESWIGVSSDFVWIGTGPEALGPLKAAIESAAKPADSDVILKIDGNLLPWAERAKKLVEELPEPESLDDKQLRREHLLRLTQAIEAFTDKDEARFNMTVEDGKVSGQIFLNTGILRFIGMQIATFSRDTLDG